MSDNDKLDGLLKELEAELQSVQNASEKDLVIDTIQLDESALTTPKLNAKWMNKYNEQVMILKDLYAYKDAVKLERWKYYTGKQTSEYIARHGVLHEKILKSDVEIYMNADPVLTKVNQVISAQKTIVDHIERVLKEIGNRGFHIKSAIEWRRFMNGG